MLVLNGLLCQVDCFCGTVLIKLQLIVMDRAYDELEYKHKTIPEYPILHSCTDPPTQTNILYLSTKWCDCVYVFLKATSSKIDSFL